MFSRVGVLALLAGSALSSTLTMPKSSFSETLPVVKTDKVTVVANGSLSAPVLSGTLQVDVSYGGVPMRHTTEDLCSVIACPHASGQAQVIYPVTIPQVAPSGLYQITISGKDSHDASLFTTHVNYAGGASTDSAVIFANFDARESAPETKVIAFDVGANFDVSIDVLGIAKAIAGAIAENEDRPGWVKNLMESAFFDAGQKYNVMVFNLNENYEHSFNDLVFYGSASYDGIIFGIWIFESGTFVNQGDGGYINWAFQGWFDRNGNSVTFYQP